MNKESIGKKYKNGNDVYECIAYADKPTITMKNVETGERMNFVVDSMLANAFVEIIEEDKIEKLNIIQEKNCKGNWKWKCNGYNISTPQKIIGDKVNALIDKLNSLED